MNMIQLLVVLVAVMTVVTLGLALSLRKYRKKLEADCRQLYKSMDELNAINIRYANAVKARRSLEADLNDAIRLNSAYRVAAGQSMHDAMRTHVGLPSAEKRRPRDAKWASTGDLNQHRRNSDNPFDTRFHDAAAVSVAMFGESSRDIPVPVPPQFESGAGGDFGGAGTTGSWEAPTPSAAPAPVAYDALSPAPAPEPAPSPYPSYDD